VAYFSNSSEDVLSAQCSDCPLGYGWNNPDQQTLFDREAIPEPCPVAFVQMQMNYDQIDKGQEKLRSVLTSLVDNKGTCQVREILVRRRREGKDRV